MPSYPNVDESEGLIRTHDLLEVLLADIYEAYEALEADRNSQYLRRCVGRAIFSYVEAAIECVKVELRSSVRRSASSVQLTTREEETLGSLSGIKDGAARFLPLDDNIKRTFKLAAKVWGIKFRLETDGQEFREFLAAKSARNRLTHPRTYYDVEVTDRDMHSLTVAYMWVESEFLRLFRLRVQSLAKGLSDEDRKVFISVTRFKKEPA